MFEQNTQESTAEPPDPQPRLLAYQVPRACPVTSIAASAPSSTQAAAAAASQQQCGRQRSSFHISIPPLQLPLPTAIPPSRSFRSTGAKKPSRFHLFLQPFGRISISIFILVLTLCVFYSRQCSRGRFRRSRSRYRSTSTTPPTTRSKMTSSKYLIPLYLFVSAMAWHLVLHLLLSLLRTSSSSMAA